MFWKTISVIKYQNPFDSNWQASGSSHTVLLTKVSTGGPHPSRSSIFLSHSVFIYIFPSSHHQLHIVIINNDTKKEKESNLKEGLETAGNPEILKVASGLLSCFPLQHYVQLQLNKRRENKVTILLPKYSDLTLGELRQ